MKTLLFLIVLILLGCSDSQPQSTANNERLELLPEPDKVVREAYEDNKKDSTLKVENTTTQKEAKSSIQVEQELKLIRKNFKRINSIQKWDSIQKIELWESTEGGEATYYLTNRTLEKIMVRNFGEMYQNITEYYLLNNELSFVFDQFTRYNRPIYWDSTAMLENNDNEVWDMEKSNITEVRSYFKNNTLIHQLQNQDTEELNPSEENILSAYNEIIRLMSSDE